MKQIPLSLEPDQVAPGAPEQKPYLGWCAVGFGLLGIFVGPGFVFVPLGLICSIIALFVGQAGWGILGILLAFFGFLTSPHLWFLLGVGWLLVWMDWESWLKPLIDLLKFGGGGVEI